MSPARQPAMPGSHPGGITALQHPEDDHHPLHSSDLETAADCRKAMLKLMAHSNKARIPRQKARAAEVVVFRLQ